MQYGPRATHRREGEYDRTTAANDARRNVLISDDRWTDENSPQTCSGLLVGREFASPDATRTVEAMCRTRYRNLPFVLRATSTPRRLVPSTPSAPGTESRRASSPLPSRGGIRPRRGRPRQSARARGIEPGRVRVPYTVRPLARVHTRCGASSRRPGIGRPRVFSSRRMTVRRETVSRLSTHNGAPHFCAPHFCAPHFCAPHFCAPHFCAPSLLRHGTPRAVLVDVSRRPDEVSFAVPPSRRDVRARAYLGSRRRLLDGAKPFGQSTNLHLHALARFANGGEDHLRVASSIGAIHLERSKRAKNHVLRFLLARRGSHRRAVYAVENLATRRR